MRKIIDLHRADPEYRKEEELMQTERTKRNMMSGALILGAIGVIGSLTVRTMSLFSGRRMF